jgi:DNA polymerase III alpha subunit (gram-positive type)
VNKNEKIIAFDCETGGITTDMSMLTAYFAILNNKLDLIDELDLACKPNDDKPYVVTAEGLEINGINLVQHNKSSITYGAAGKKIRELTMKHSDNGKVKLIPLGHNVHFDIGFITEHLLSSKNWNQFVSYRVLDTQVVARHLQIKGSMPDDISISLGNLINHLNIQVPGRQHEAKYDTLATIEIYKRLLKI